MEINDEDIKVKFAEVLKEKENFENELNSYKTKYSELEKEKAKVEKQRDELFLKIPLVSEALEEKQPEKISFEESILNLYKKGK